MTNKLLSIDMYAMCTITLLCDSPETVTSLGEVEPVTIVMKTCPSVLALRCKSKRKLSPLQV
jgi:hypothetical protein